MKNKNYVVIYDNVRYLCSNRRLTDDVEKARFFDSSRSAFEFAKHDILSGRAEVFDFSSSVRVCVVSFRKEVY